MTDAPAPGSGLRVRRVRAAYRQVADQLREQILTGTLPSGTRLPSEAELTGLFGVSRSTVREALRLLASQHLIDRSEERRVGKSRGLGGREMVKEKKLCKAEV